MASLDIWVDPETIGDWMRISPDGAIEVLATFASGFENVETAERFARELAREHCGSNAHQCIAPFLRLLADALEATEAGL